MLSSVEGAKQSQYEERICGWMKSNWDVVRSIVPVRPSSIGFSQTEIVRLPTEGQLVLQIKLFRKGSLIRPVNVTVTDSTKFNEFLSSAQSDIEYANTEMDYFKFSEVLVSWNIDDMDEKTVNVRLREGFREGKIIDLSLSNVINGIVGKSTLSYKLNRNSSGDEILLFVVVIGGCAIAVLLLVLFSFLFYNRTRKNKLLNSLEWIIEGKDIAFESQEKMRKASFQNTFSASHAFFESIARSSVVKDSAKLLLSEHDLSQTSSVAPSNCCYYNGMRCRLDLVRKEDFSLTHAIIVDMNRYRLCRHSNLVMFIGATIVPPELLVLTEYCSRGTLTDLYETLAEGFSWTFKLHIIMDILSGMEFIHKSNIYCHGHLRTSNCLVDKSWTCKISGFGLDNFKCRSASVRKASEKISIMNSTDSSSAKGKLTSHNSLESMNDVIESASKHMLYWAPEILLQTVKQENANLNQGYFRRKTAAIGLGFDWESDISTMKIVSFEQFLRKLDPHVIAKTPSGDVWSFGMILKELITSQPPSVSLLVGDCSSSENAPLKLFYDRVVLNQSPLEYYSENKIDRDLTAASLINSGTPEVHTKCILMMLEECLNQDHLRRISFKELQKILTSHDPSLKNTSVVDQLNKFLEEHATSLEMLVEKRTESLNIEKAKVEQLLGALLPTPIADQLMQGNCVKPESFDEVTIFFSDIVGFTTICGKLEPLEVVDMLNYIYTVFDTITDIYDAYKVETIGDAYMIVSGLPMRNGHLHVREIVSFAISLVDKFANFTIPHLTIDTPIEVRIGIHTGPVAAGVVGTKMPRYCLFGDTVNTASRMETNSLPSRIHLSESSRKVLVEHHSHLCQTAFRLEERGTIPVKGKGDMKTYWVAKLTSCKDDINEFSKE